MAQRVLIVDDTASIIALIRSYLGDFGFEFFEAPDGEAGLEVAQKVEPNLIISDVSMPRMDGFELCAAVRCDERLGETPLLLVTSMRDPETREKGLLLGASAFLNKPVIPLELRTTVGDLLGVPVPSERRNDRA